MRSKPWTCRLPLPLLPLALALATSHLPLAIAAATTYLTQRHASTPARVAGADRDHTPFTPVDAPIHLQSLPEDGENDFTSPAGGAHGDQGSGWGGAGDQDPRRHRVMDLASSGVESGGSGGGGGDRPEHEIYGATICGDLSEEGGSGAEDPGEIDPR